LPFYIQQQLTLRVSVWIFLVRLSVWRTNWTDSKTGQLCVCAGPFNWGHFFDKKQNPNDAALFFTAQMFWKRFFACP
jgi:hypothetical protein